MKRWMMSNALHFSVDFSYLDFSAYSLVLRI